MMFRSLVALIALLVSAGSAMAQPAGMAIPPGSYAYTQNSTDPNKVNGQVTIEVTASPTLFTVTVKFQNADGSWSDKVETQTMELIIDSLDSRFGCYVRPLGESGFMKQIGTNSEVAPKI